ncbi:hypothetical protein [Allomuricauda sp. d1]|uniref:hypothetical protein n=1 Tax=Allomuricauda sp. d1 TaxID=3136725 RepID=UPI0031D1EC87
MNKSIVFNWIACFFVCSLNAQIAQNNNATLGTLNDLGFFVEVNNSKYAGAEGSKYLFDEFVPAKINQVKTSHAVRFDVVDNIIEFKDSERETKGLSAEKEYSIVLQDGSSRVFVTKKFIDDYGKSSNTFFEKMYANEYFELFKKERIKFQEAKPAKSSYEPEKPAKFVGLPDAFYLDFKDDNSEELVKIPRKRKKLKEFFGKEYPSIEKFAKKNDLDFDSATHLVKIINHYIEL